MLKDTGRLNAANQYKELLKKQYLRRKDLDSPHDFDLVSIGMLRRRPSPPHPLDGRPSAQLLNTGAERLGISAEEEDLAATDRYDPMTRLLSEDDQLWLNGQGFPEMGRRVRSFHRACYREYLRLLAQEVRASRKRMRCLMETTQQWDIPTFLSTVVFSETTLLYLRWLCWKQAFGLAIDVDAIRHAVQSLSGVIIGSPIGSYGAS